MNIFLISSSFTPSKIRDIIVNSSVPLEGWDLTPVVGDRINAYNALTSFCVYEDELLDNDACTVDAPLRCVNHEIVKDCTSCGCPAGHRCDGLSGGCIKVKPTRATAIARPGELI